MTSLCVSPFQFQCFTWALPVEICPKLCDGFWGYLTESVVLVSMSSSGLFSSILNVSHTPFGLSKDPWSYTTALLSRDLIGKLLLQALTWPHLGMDSSCNGKGINVS